jgi:ABC-type Zn uptake system ZnuABC Zn-binding protein ZnuA
LYTAARASNIRIVEIDATQPWSTTLEGIAVATVPAPLAPWANPDGQGNNESSLWYWLSLGNTVRSLDIVAADLERLFPEQQAAIVKNQTSFRSELLALQRTAQQALASADDITVFSLAEELVYFISELGLFVDGSFYKQDIEWTDEDLANFEDYLINHDIPVVLHKWEPSEQIIAAIAEAGAELVVLETLDVGIIEQGRMQPDSYLQLMGNNLAAVITALGGVFRR